MEAIREYLIGVTAAALVCALVTRLQGKGTVGAVIRLMAGLFMALAVVSPWLDIRLDGLVDFTSDLQLEADALAAQGENSAREAMAEVITGQTRTYILDKAASLGASLTVEVALTAQELPVPRAVTLRGSISPYAKQELSAYIAVNLGIGTEAQTWIQS